MEWDRQILKCLPTYLEISELFHIATTTLVLLSEGPNNFSCIDELVYRLKPNQLKPNLITKKRYVYHSFFKNHSSTSALIFGWLKET